MTIETEGLPPVATADDDSLRRIEIPLVALDSAATARKIERALRAVEGVASAAVAPGRRVALVAFDERRVGRTALLEVIRQAGCDPRLTRFVLPLYGTALSAPSPARLEGRIEKLPGVASAIVDLFRETVTIHCLADAGTVRRAREAIRGEGYETSRAEGDTLPASRRGRLAAAAAFCIALVATAAELPLAAAGSLMSRGASALGAAGEPLLTAPPLLLHVVLLAAAFALALLLRSELRRSWRALRSLTLHGEALVVAAIAILLAVSLASSVMALFDVRAPFGLHYASAAAVAAVFLLGKQIDQVMRARLSATTPQRSGVDPGYPAGEAVAREIEALHDGMIDRSRTTGVRQERIASLAPFLASAVSLVIFVLVLTTMPRGNADLAILAMATILAAAAPRAFGLAPRALVRNLARAARARGLAFLDADVLRRLGRARSLFLGIDVLRSRAPMVSDFVLIGQTDQKELLRLACAAAARWPQPFAAIIVRRAEGAGPVAAPSRCEATRAGVIADIGPEIVTVGFPHFAEAKGIALDAVREEIDRFAAERKPAIIVARNGRLAGVIAIDAPLHDDAAGVSAALKRLDVSPVLVTSDPRPASAATARLAAIDVVVAEAGREEKIEAVRRGAKQRVAVAVANDDEELFDASDISIVMLGASSSRIPPADAVVWPQQLDRLEKLFSLAASFEAASRRSLLQASAYHGGVIVLAAIVVALPIVAPVIPPLAMIASVVASIAALSTGRNLANDDPDLQRVPRNPKPARPATRNP